MGQGKCGGKVRSRMEQVQGTCGDKDRSRMGARAGHMW